MLSRFWQWLSRLWRRPEPEPQLSPEAARLLEEAHESLRRWAANKLRNDIIAAMQDDRIGPDRRA